MTDLPVLDEPGPVAYRVEFSGGSRAPQPLDVDGLHSANDPQLLTAVLAHVRPRWPGAVLEVRVNRRLMRGRVFAGAPTGRRVAAFTLTELGADAPTTATAPALDAIVVPIQTTDADVDLAGPLDWAESCR